jgi:hypothetical protein
MIEMRWLIQATWDGPEQVLQYRQKHDIIDYSRKDSNGVFLKTTEMTDWVTVPTVDEVWNADI